MYYKSFGFAFAFFSFYIKGLGRASKNAEKLLSGEENEPQTKKSFTISSLQEKRWGKSYFNNFYYPMFLQNNPQAVLLCTCFVIPYFVRNMSSFLPLTWKIESQNGKCTCTMNYKVFSWLSRLTLQWEYNLMRILHLHRKSSCILMNKFLVNYRELSRLFEKHFHTYDCMSE